MRQLGYVENQIEEIDFYPLHEPFAYVEIIREKESLDKRYVLIEMQLTEQEARLLKFMKETLSGFAFDTMELEKKGENQYLAEKVDQIIDEYMLNNDAQSKKKIMYYLEKEFLGLGKLEVLMKDANIEDISCDGSGVSIFLYHRRFGSLKSNVQFVDEDELSAFVVKLAQKCGKHISISEPMLDATMPDGSRIQMTLSAEVTTKGSTFTIRKFSEDPFSPPDLVEFNLKLWILNARVDSADHELYEKMRKAGVEHIVFGVESGDQDILSYYNKNITLDQIRKAIRLSHEMGFFTTAHFILGAPIETPRHIQHTIAFIRSLPFDNILIRELGYAAHSPLWQEAVDHGKINPNEDLVVAGRERDLGHFTTRQLQCYCNQVYYAFTLNPRYLIRQARYALEHKNPRFLRLGARILFKP